MKIIIVGCGKVGATLAEQLNNEHHDIMLIDKNANVINSMTERIDVMGVVGNGAVYKVQMEAGIQETDLLIATTNSDELNMLCCLIAKKAGNCHTIARIRNPEYDSEIRYIREELGLSMAINPEMAAAMEIARLLRFPSAIKIDTFAKGRIDILKFLVQEQSILHNMKVREVLSRLHCNVLICAIEHGSDVLIPSGESVMMAGDKISFIASPSEANKFFKQAGIDNNAVKTAMLVGGGKITYYVAKLLENTKISVKILEQNVERCNELSELLPRVMVIHGDASDQELLLQEGIGQTDAFASLTGFDEENIMLSLYAASQSKAKLITKVNRIAFENVIDSMNLGSVIYPKLITADTILQYVRAMQNSMGSNVETLYKIVADRAEALEFRVAKEPSIVGIPLEKLALKNNLLVACIIRRGRLISPRGKDTMEEGDRVIVVTTVTGLNDLKDILR
ncbi:Trk system potassium transporter TrkA [Lacrimispora saccharolytica]|uniref:Trk system potassium uptake protein TrkA n=1 Tax=Lacrimispora saccharolytica (strain ATCC 35040 / DSM 2544 / NRCC 2533 / WM1) TaxID=610130 RepID=D9R129_LACSW|nr:Trk system potassium transporter TrkA [Lacrimispora saccharolytica]ADL04576.1 TrkA-N domain protein [[Clostridium] saccharolyticum WM1]QRV21178.1 Trk system potassium transporter TrkA [Lacrimispora saccharolytica]